MIKLRIFFLILLGVVCLSPARAEERAAQALASEGGSDRVALVIGNSAYIHTNHLNNPKNDATDIAAILRKLKFEVIEGSELDLSGMVRHIQEFAHKAETAKVAIFYYAGHGIQVDGRNYLIPTDAKLQQKAMLEYQTIDLDRVMGLMAGEGRVAIVLLDACRDNPLARRYQQTLGLSRSTAVGEGLADPEARADGLLVGFATSPGHTAADGSGRNSPYASALLKHLEEPNAHIEQILKKVSREVLQTTGNSQRPWYSSSLSDDFVVNPQKEQPAEVKTRTANILGMSLSWPLNREQRRKWIDYMLRIGVSDDKEGSYKFEETGVVITSVDPAGPAAKVGVLPGDILVEADYLGVNTPEDFAERIKQLEFDSLYFGVLRGEKPDGLTFFRIDVKSNNDSSLVKN